MPGPGEGREAERRIESTERGGDEEAGGGGGEMARRETETRKGQRKIREGAKWKMEQDGREQRGKMMCAVNVESWQSG